MTGSKKGYTTTFKRLSGRPLQWVLCLLYLNELPLRHVFQMLDGSTSGPDTFRGSIDKQLSGLVFDGV